MQRISRSQTVASVTLQLVSVLKSGVCAKSSAFYYSYEVYRQCKMKLSFCAWMGGDQLNWLNVNDRVRFKLALLAYKSLHGLALARLLKSSIY